MARNAHAPPANRDAAAALLGGRSVRAFLTAHWHKQALLVRGAIPGFSGPFDAAALARLAQRDEVESRLVVRERSRWTVAHGPFRRADFNALGPRGWTLLVQGVNLHSDEAERLLRRFAFIPFARLDDLMVSCAAPGGGVGPHVDSYDVFLLQGFGRRRWRYGRQDDHALRPGLPLPILRCFAPEHDAVLGPGDMLYLPPQYAHDGIALEPCTTYSIGFRAPSGNELATAFLDHLRDQLDVPGRYADPDLAATATPARLPTGMRRQCARMLRGIRWDDATIARFLGCFLSEPKPQVFFEPPSPPLPRRAFARRAARHGLHLDRRTQLLYDDRQVFANGVALPWPAASAAAIRHLADRRALSAREARALGDEALALLHDWYRDGFLHTDTA
jgi:50S ribosomal protein L16 3-hydroxylase